MKNGHYGFTLIELLFVIAVIAILAAVAIPYYKGYVIRAKLVEVEYTISHVKDAVTDYRRENGNMWPNCPGINEIRTSLGVRAGAVTRVQELRVDRATGTITAVVANIDTIIDGKSVMLIPSPSPVDGSVSWAWGYSANFPARFRQRTSR